ncbi:predicted protein [Plenodomus lingam JN3]|uniref:Predicted protein n=1 Tax=Leptosphaeria maculans (strain JN3 / isolate v23.1.3 / race Av1-4-5-6-7-8) TaxID=985895 RepID=E4ZMD3_LEPMJ|nr:predicted protein [Plenodomus lingam JN3]CBX92482.1 predicted protein [Plenodomus lingam JN3]
MVGVLGDALIWRVWCWKDDWLAVLMSMRHCLGGSVGVQTRGEPSLHDSAMKGKPTKLSNFFKNTLFILEHMNDGILGSTLSVDRDAYRPAFSVWKVYLEDATLATIPVPFIEDWNLAVRAQSRDGGG